MAIGPALIAGAIGLASALLSYRSSQAALARAEREHTANREHERDLLVRQRRLAAVEDAWHCIFDLEREQHLDERARARLVGTTVWLPQDARAAVLHVLVLYGRDSTTPEERKQALKRSRDLLLSLVNVTTEGSS